MPLMRYAELVALDIDDLLGTRARLSRARLAGLCQVENLRSVHIQQVKVACEMIGIGLHELESGALGLIRISALDGAKHL